MEWNWYQTIADLKSKNESFVLVTITEVSGSAPREVGTKMIVRALEKSPAFFGTIGGGQLESQVHEDARKLFTLKESQKIRYPLGAKSGQCCGGVVECFLEWIPSSATLYLFGSGHVGLALSQVLSQTALKVVVIDDREEWLNQLPKDVVGTRAEAIEFLENELATINPSESYFAIMTHSHALDFEICFRLLQKEYPYIGLIGSHSKRSRFEKMLQARGLSQEQILKLHCPMGEKLGESKAPKEVAISISAEILKTYYEQRATLNPSRRAVLPNGLTQRSALEHNNEVLLAD